MIRTRTDTDKKTIIGAEVRTNPISQYLLKLLDNKGLTDNLNEEQFLEKTGLSESQLENLEKYLEQFWGLEKTSQESWLQFFERVIFEIDNNFDDVAQEITQGQVPENMQELVSELDAYEEKIAQIKKRSKVELPKETDRFITRLQEKALEKYNKSVDELDSDTLQKEAAIVSAEQELEEYVNQTIDSPDLQTRAKQRQQRGKVIEDSNREIIEKVIATQAPDADLSDQDINLITTASLGKNTVWHQPIQQKCDNSAEIIKQLEKVNPETLNQQIEVAQQVEPELREHIDFENQEISDDAIEKASRDIASSLMTAKAQGWQIEAKEAPVISQQVALTLDSHNIKLKESMDVQQVADAALEPMADMDINAQGVGAINQISVQANVNLHLQQKGLDLTPEQMKDTSETIGRVFFMPKASQMRFLYRSYPEGENGEKAPNPLEAERKIPPNPIELLNRFQNKTYQGFLKQTFIYHYTQNFTPDELKGEIFKLSQMQSLVRDTTAGGPVINMHSLQLDAAQTVINHPLYQTMSPLVKLGKNKIINRLGETAIGRGVKTGINKAGSWLASKIGMAGVEGAAGGTIATALGVPTGGTSLLVWGGIELLKIGAKNIFGGFKKFFKGVGGFFKDVFSSGKTEAERQKVGVLGNLQKGLGFANTAIAGLLAIPIGINVGPIIIYSFIIFFGVMLLGFFPQHLMTQSRRRPPLGRGDEQGIAEEEFQYDIEDIAVDLDSCDIPNQNAKLACLLDQVISQCVPEGKVSSSNVNQIEPCIRNTEELMTMLSEGEIIHVVNQINQSAKRFDVLQCVGFKRAVEPSLPGCGDAKHFLNSEKPGCTCETAETIEPGVNAVYGGGAFGHIAIVVDTNDSGEVFLAQAWGGSGRVNITKVPIASVDEFIDCR